MNNWKEAAIKANCELKEIRAKEDEERKAKEIDRMLAMIVHRLSFVLGFEVDEKELRVTYVTGDSNAGITVELDGVEFHNVYQHDISAHELTMHGVCPNCKQTVRSTPIHSLSDVGELLECFHPNGFHECVPSEVGHAQEE